MATEVGRKNVVTVRIACQTEELYNYVKSLDNKSVFFREKLLAVKENRYVNLKVRKEVIEKYVADPEHEYIIDRLLTNYYNGNVVFVDSISQVKKLENKYNNKTKLDSLDKLETSVKSNILTNDEIACDSNPRVIGNEETVLEVGITAEQEKVVEEGKETGNDIFNIDLEKYAKVNNDDNNDDNDDAFI